MSHHQLTTLFNAQVSNSELIDPLRGYTLPGDFASWGSGGFDQFHRPQHINMQTISEYYKNDILAVDRLFLPESQRKFPLFPYQRVIMRECTRADFVWLQMMRGGAKSSTLARWALIYALQNANIPIIFTAPSFRQALLMFDEVIRTIDLNDKDQRAIVRIKNELVGEPKRNALECIIRFKNGSSIRALPMGNGEKIRGIRGGVLIIDEFYQITSEMYQDHIRPFVGVKQGNRESKIIYSTTSWTQDCYAYKRLMEIVAEVKVGNPQYAMLDFNLEHIMASGFPLSESVVRDADRHGSPVTMAMTYYNIWPRASARWFSQYIIDEALSSEKRVRIERGPRQGGRYFFVIDVASSDKGDSTFYIIYKWTGDRAEAVSAGERTGLNSNERAWLVHELYDRWGPEFIIYDSHGAIGSDLRKDLAMSELLVHGQVKNVRPLVHHDAYSLPGVNVLIPTSPTDSAVRAALLGADDGSTLRGEAGFRNTMMLETRELLAEGFIVGPSLNISAEADDIIAREDLENAELINKAFNQLGYIGPAKDKDGNVIRNADGQLKFETRSGRHDDGGMCIVYSSIGINRLIDKNPFREHAAPIATPFVRPEWEGFDLSQPAETIQKIQF